MSAPPPSQPLWYEQAEVYDLAFAWDPKPEVEFLIDVFEREQVPPKGLLLEPFMGSGRLWPGLRAHGYQCAGFDYSRSMVKRAHQRLAHDSSNSHPLIWQGNAARFALRPQFDAAHCLIDSFRYLRTEREARAFMDSIARSLKPNAPFILGLELHQAGPPAEESWTTDFQGQQIRTTIFSHGNAGPDLQWMDVKVTVETPPEPKTFKSRSIQRIWQPRAFLNFIDSLDYFDVASMHPRTHQIDRVLQALPARGGPIILVLARNDGAVRTPQKSAATR